MYDSYLGLTRSLAMNLSLTTDDQMIRRISLVSIYKSIGLFARSDWLISEVMKKVLITSKTRETK